jgi:hypothetical protein
MALAARREGLTREGFADAIDGGDLVLAHLVRGAIHAVAPDGWRSSGAQLEELRIQALHRRRRSSTPRAS